MQYKNLYFSNSDRSSSKHKEHYGNALRNICHGLSLTLSLLFIFNCTNAQNNADSAQVKCPFCKEEIKKDAIKCKHCHSLLYKIESNNTTTTEGQNETAKDVTYIFDKDLVRFLKFAISILAIFITVGIILYGVDLKQTVKEVNEAKSNLEEANRKLTETLPKIHSLEEEINKIKEEVDDARLKATEALREINATKEQAVVLVGYMKTLNPEQKANRNEENFSSKLDFQDLWKAGQDIKIYFMNGVPTQIEKVKKIAAEWTQFANLKFVYRNDMKSSEVRISFKGPGMWSYVGTNCLAISKDEPTMALLVSSDKMISSGDRQSILREFGFMIGLLNEEQNPNSNIKWNRKKVYAEYAAPPNNWTKAMVDRHFFDTWPAKSKPFDPESVMMSPVTKELTMDGFHAGWNDHLSPQDKKFIARLYPK